MSMCEDAPCCGHRECGFGPGVPGYGSMVDGVPYYGEHKRLVGPTVTQEQIDEEERKLEEMLATAKRDADGYIL